MATGAEGSDSATGVCARVTDPWAALSASCPPCDHLQPVCVAHISVDKPLAAQCQLQREGGPWRSKDRQGSSSSCFDDLFFVLSTIMSLEVAKRSFTASQFSQRGPDIRSRCEQHTL